MSTPDSANIYCGTGEVWFNRFDDDGNPTAFRHLGNVSKLDVTPSTTTVEMQSSMNGARATIAQAITALKMEVDVTMTEWDKKNVALALLGDDSAFSQSKCHEDRRDAGHSGPRRGDRYGVPQHHRDRREALVDDLRRKHGLHR